MTELLKFKCRTCFNAKKGWKSLKTKTCDNKKQLKCYAELLEEITKIHVNIISFLCISYCNY